jgi:hypothetical protein
VNLRLRRTHIFILLLFDFIWYFHLCVMKIFVIALRDYLRMCFSFAHLFLSTFVVKLDVLGFVLYSTG